eukprot:TRINITY_DN1883_c0_g2_i2.p1 TRINITY_DN1883_c0_g2~~TRINITY_DN1883_c0_g2_i2.p1  ORF type:complete len:127 (+),score=13.79 TRINITY_DN1883_c0_g2_i2:221-601(+)
MYVLRSKKNIDESDGTVAFRLKFGIGTDQSIGYCLTKKWALLGPDRFLSTNYKPCLVVRDISADNEQLNQSIVTFVKHHQIVILNVAGHRDSKSSGVPDFEKRIECILTEALSKLCYSQNQLQPVI